jgi:phosphoglycerate dehydrogenase-like enzyme
MTYEKPDLLLVGPSKPLLAKGLEPAFTSRPRTAKPSSIALQTACGRWPSRTPAFMQRFPKLEFVSSFGVDYDHVDAKWAGSHGVIVTNTPDVLNEEVADTTLGLLQCTVREFPQADRFARAPANGSRVAIR